MIVHEYQHSILGVLLDLCELFDPRDQQHLTVAWRTDPRPVEGVLQGTFAHLAVADMWRARAEREDLDGAALAAYRQYLGWTTDAIEVLVGSGALTALGNRFVESMARTIASWRE